MKTQTSQDVIAVRADGLATFYCPGCDTFHTVRVVGQDAWKFNGDLVRPTLEPSVLVSGQRWNFKLGKSVNAQCHSFVRDGQIQFLSDCAHSLAAKTVPLPKLMEHE